MRRRNGLSFAKRRKTISSEIVKEIFSWIFGCLACVFIAFVLVYSVGMKTTVIGVSMENTLYNGQEILVNRIKGKTLPPHIGDVVVFYPNGNKNTHYYVKRVVAGPGDRVQIKNGSLYVNREIMEYGFDKIADSGIAENELKLEQDEYFVMGDNCNNSEDSRSGNIGLVKRNTIEGTAWLRLPKAGSGMGFIH